MTRKRFQPAPTLLIFYFSLETFQIEIKSNDTFVRPIYAGNALLTVQSSDPVKVLTVRATAFEKTGDGGIYSKNLNSVPEASAH